MPDTLPENLFPLIGKTPGTAEFYDLTLVKPGRFLMGSNAENSYEDEKPAHEIRCEEPFYIGTFLVTKGQWEAVFPENKPSKGTGRPIELTNLPVEYVSWHDIVDGSQGGGPPEAFLTRINREFEKDPYLTGYAFRLPTEAEWEYAAKGGHLAPQVFEKDTATSDLYPEYAGSDELERVGWFKYNNEFGTHPIGLKQPNVLGLYDLSGNVEEWCADTYDSNTYRERLEKGIIDPAAIEATEEWLYHRVLRGGSWRYHPQSCRLSFRNDFDPEYRDYHIGFRLVLAPVRASE